MGWRKRMSGQGMSAASCLANPEVHKFGLNLCATIGQGSVVRCAANNLYIEFPNLPNGEFGGGFEVDIDRTHYTVSGEFVFDEDNNYHRPPTEQSLTMRVSTKRGIEGLAADIKRKFLPHYPAQLQAMKDEADAADASRNQALEAYKSVCAAAGVEFSERYYSEKTVYGGSGTYIYSMNVNSDGGVSRALVDGIPPEAVPEFIEMVKELHTKYGKKR